MKDKILKENMLRVKDLFEDNYHLIGSDEALVSLLLTKCEEVELLEEAIEDLKDELELKMEEIDNLEDELEEYR